MNNDPMQPPVLRIGDVEVQRIVEMVMPFMAPEDLYPKDAEAAREGVAAMRSELEPWGFDAASGKLIFVVQAYVLRTRHHTIIVDTCVGCHKSYPTIPAWNQRTDDSWLNRLIAAGVDPASVDYVFCTHLHGDHVGWNTRLLDGRWVPTFPNATYLMTSIDEAFIKETRRYTHVESVAPILEAGQATLIGTDFALDDQVWATPTPGHTPGHVAVHVRSNGEEGVLTGDAFHITPQCRHPDWRFFSDADPAQAAVTRRALFEAHCDVDRLILPSHVPGPGVGRIVGRGDAFDYRFLQ